MTPNSETRWRPRLSPDDVFLPGRLPLRVLRRDPQPDFAEHRHEAFHELVLVLGGSGLHLSGQSSIPLGAGDVFVITGVRPHRYQRTKALRLVNLAFSNSILEFLSRHLGGLPGFRAMFQIEPQARASADFSQFMRLSPAQLSRILPLVDSIERETEAETPAPGYEAMAQGLFLQLATDLARFYSSQEGRGRGADRLVALARVLEHMEKHYARPLPQKELENAAGMSGRTLRRHFQDVLGQSPAGHLLKLRLDAARRLLAEGRLSITEAALEAGFSDGNYFTRQFKRAEGMAPREWKRKATLGANSALVPANARQ